MSPRRIKVIIAYASAGAGHFKAAEAVYKYLQQCDNTECTLIDVLNKTSPLFGVSYIHGYSFLVNHATALWRFSFWLTGFKPLRKITRKIALFINRANSKDFIKFLCQQNPDFVVSTHFLPSEIASDLKLRNKISSKVVTVITDFGVHPFWVCPGTDKYIVASEYSKSKLLKEGINTKDIIASGIPVDPKFFVKTDKAQLCLKLGIKDNKFTVLIFTGSFGIGPIEKIVDILHNDVQLLVVCARNQALFNKLKAKKYTGVFVFGFIDNVEELMAVSDTIITKPGGLSTAEILNTESAPIFIHPIPGQETENIKALNYYGIGVYAKDLKDIKRLVDDYKNNLNKIELARNNIRELRKSFLPQEICNVIC